MKEQELQLLLDINNAVATLQDKEELFTTIIETLRPIFRFDAAVIIAFDREHKHFQLFVKRVMPEFEQNESFRNFTQRSHPIAGSPAEMMIQNPTVRITSYEEMALRYEHFPPFRMLHEVGVKQGMVAPLKCGGEVIGILSIVSRSENNFNREDVGLFEAIAGQIAIAVNNTIVYEELRARETEKAMQLAVSNALATIKDREKMFRAVAIEIDKVVPCEFFGIRVRKGEGEIEAFANLAKTPNGELITVADMVSFKSASVDLMMREVFAGRFHPTILTDEEFRHVCEHYSIGRHFRDLYNIQSVMYVPLRVTDDTFTVMVLCQNRPNGFRTEDTEIIGRLAPQISLALENLFAFEQIESLRRRLELEKISLLDEIRTTYNFGELVGASVALHNVLKQVELVAPTDTTVLIQGETGTGKELVARALHNRSSRGDRALVKVNCASLPAQLIESELFGHEKGSFTGATDRRVGKFEMADGGTIFLDEIGELPLELQAKLLRVLQEREIERIGGRAPFEVDVRVIAATNRDLRKEVEAGRFRSDLFFRLDVFPITVPPLRERPEDIPLLARHFVEKFAKKMSRPITGIKERAILELMRYDWPGNIRELENIVERAVIVSSGPNLDIGPLASSRPLQQPDGAGFKSLEEAEREHILSVLKFTRGRVSGAGGAAEILKLKPTTLESRLKRLGIRIERQPARQDVRLP